MHNDEVIVLHFDDGREMVIHAMPMRTYCCRLLPRPPALARWSPFAPTQSSVRLSKHAPPLTTPQRARSSAKLDDIEHTHVLDLVRAAKQSPPRRPAKPLQVRPTVQQVLDSITDGAAFIRSRRADFLTGNRLAYALYADAFATLDRPVSLPRFVFLDPRSRTSYRKWEGLASATVGSLRAEAARDPYDGDLTQLIGELSMRSDDFRRMWSTHDVNQYRSGTQYFHHELVGDVDLDYESFDLPGDIVAQTLVVYTAKPGTPSHVALQRLAAGTSEPSERP